MRNIEAGADGDVYFSRGGEIVVARRINRRLSPETDPRTRPAFVVDDGNAAFRDALARGRTTGKNTLILALAPYDMPLNHPIEALMADPTTSAILRRRFEVVFAKGGVPRRVGGKLQTDAWTAILGLQAFPMTGIITHGSKVVWNGRPEPGEVPVHGNVPIGAPAAVWEVETFVRALRRGSPLLSAGEAETIRRFAIRNGALFMKDNERNSEDQELRKETLSSVRAGRYEEALVSALRRDERNAALPDNTDLAFVVTRLSDKAKELAQKGEPKAAADLLVRTLRLSNVGTLQATDRSPLSFAMALYGIADDREAARAARDLIERLPEPFLRALAICVAPNVDTDPVARLASLPLAPVVSTSDRCDRALAAIRAGRHAEAEAEMRQVVVERANELSGVPVLKRWTHQVLSLALAHQGRGDEARAELAIAASIYSGDTSDATLLATGDIGKTTFVLLRREILTLIDGK